MGMRKELSQHVSLLTPHAPPRKLEAIIDHWTTLEMWYLDESLVNDQGFYCAQLEPWTVLYHLA